MAKHTATGMDGRMAEGGMGGSGRLIALCATAAWSFALPTLAQTAAVARPQTTPAPPSAGPAGLPPRHEPLAQDQAKKGAQTTVVKSVTVTAQPKWQLEYGAVLGDVAPELQMSPADIQSYGVSTVIDLLNEIAPQTRSDRGRTASTATSPVLLLNGRRISSLNEIQNIPTEAILRVDILPEEVSLKYGYTADQRVVNFVLKPHFHAITGEVVGGETTEGGDLTGQAEADQFKVDLDTRVNLDLKYQVAGGLTDAQRGLSEPAAGAPFDFAGNVVSPDGGQIDPALSALVGKPVSVAGVPAGVGANEALSLTDFAPTAGIANVTNTAAYHSLLPATQALTANAVVARPIFWGINATLNVTLGGTTSSSLQGLPGVSLTTPAGDPFSPFSQPVVVDRFAAGESPLSQTADGWTGHIGVTLNRDVGSWRLSLTSAYNHAETVTTTATGLDASALQGLLNIDSPSLNPFGPLPLGLLQTTPFSIARAVTDGGNIQVLTNGPLVRLPAGDLYMSAKLGDVVQVAGSSSNQAGVSQSQTLTRNIIQTILNLDLPVTSREKHVLGFLGDLDLNANTALDAYSDFGLLPTLGFGVNWTPIPGYNLIVSETHDHAAPTIQQLEAPVVATPGVRLFDYETGQTATVTQLTGGNPALTADDRHVLKVGVTVKPFPTHDLTFTANYIDSHIANAIATFPAASAAIEAAFPARFLRDDDGELIEEDDRPLNFASEDRQELRWGINFSMPVGKQPPPPPIDRRAFAHRRGQGQGGFRGQGGPGALGGASELAGGASDERAGGDETGTGTPSPTPGSTSDADGAGSGWPRTIGGGGFGGRSGRGGFGSRGGGGGAAPPGGRFQFAIYHTIIFRDQFLIARGGPLLDLLGGAPAGSTGGQYQHEIEAQLGYTDNGYGARLSADWRSATTVFGGAAGSIGTLQFSDIATVNFRIWDDFTPQRALIRKYRILTGVRVTLNVTNLFNQSLIVRDSAGPTPLAYEAAFLDPTGRVISINLRKVFY